MPDFPLYKWLLGAICAFSVGVAKTGVPGFGILSVPIFVLTVGDARLSAAWLLPLLICADVFAVIYYRRHAAAGGLFSLFPWVLAGMAGGALVLSRYSDQVIRPVVGTISLLMLLLYLWRQRKTTGMPPADWKHAGFYGGSAGFATMVANAAGPIMNLYLLTKQLPREEFVATGAWFFFIVNLTKVPVYAKIGLFSAQSLAFDLALLPFVMAGALSGRKLLMIMPEKIFIRSVIVLAFAATLLLFLPK